MKKPVKQVLSDGRTLAISFTAIGAFLVIAACSPSSGALTESQKVTNEYTSAAQSKVPYPLDKMKAGQWTERRLLQEHLLRQNDPNGLRYVTLFSQQMQVIATWPIKGMAFSPDSQLTNAQTIQWDVNNTNYANGVIDSAGDNGTWGPEAGAVAFFTTSGVEIQLPASAIWIESDSPLNITTQPLITYNVDAKPSVSTPDGLNGIGGH